MGRDSQVGRILTDDYSRTLQTQHMVSIVRFQESFVSTADPEVRRTLSDVVRVVYRIPNIVHRPLLLEPSVGTLAAETDQHLVHRFAPPGSYAQ